MKKAKFRIVRIRSGDHPRYKIKEREWIFWSTVGYAEYATVSLALDALLRTIQDRRDADVVVCSYDENGVAL